MTTITYRVGRPPTAPLWKRALIRFTLWAIEPQRISTLLPVILLLVVSMTNSSYS